MSIKPLFPDKRMNSHLIPPVSGMKNKIKLAEIFAFSLILTLSLNVLSATPETHADESGSRQNTTEKIPFLGVRAGPVSEEIQNLHGLSSPRGLVVLQTLENSSADRAGIKENDIILSINEKSISSAQEAQKILRSQSSNETVQVTILRNNQKKTIQFIPGDRPDFEYRLSADKKEKTPSDSGTKSTDQNEGNTNDSNHQDKTKTEQDNQKKEKNQQKAENNRLVPSLSEDQQKFLRNFRNKMKDSLRSFRERLKKLLKERELDPVPEDLEKSLLETLPENIRKFWRSLMEELPAPMRKAIKPYLKKIIEKKEDSFSNRKKSRIPYIGIQAKKAEDGKGLLVQNVISESPADKIGLREGDVIREMDGEPMTSVQKAAQHLDEYNPGDSIPIKVERKGWVKKFTINLQKRSNSSDSPGKEQSKNSSRSGSSKTDPEPRNKKSFSLLPGTIPERFLVAPNRQVSEDESGNDSEEQNSRGPSGIFMQNLKDLDKFRRMAPRMIQSFLKFLEAHPSKNKNRFIHMSLRTEDDEKIMKVIIPAEQFFQVLKMASKYSRKQGIFQKLEEGSGAPSSSDKTDKNSSINNNCWGSKLNQLQQLGWNWLEQLQNQKSWLQSKFQSCGEKMQSNVRSMRDYMKELFNQNRDILERLDEAMDGDPGSRHSALKKKLRNQKDRIDDLQGQIDDLRKQLEQLKPPSEN